MNTFTLKSFFKWCTIINGALLLLSILGSAIAPDTAIEVHAAMFQIPKDSVSEIIYALLGTYKILWLVFNLVPYLALTIVSEKAGHKSSDI